MKAKIPYNSFSKIIMRTPLFPLNFTDEILNNKKDTLPDLERIFNTNIVEEAIFLASPDLHKELKKFFEAKSTYRNKTDNLIFALIKYLVRMSGRSTPFGLFAGFTVGNISSETKIFLMNSEHYKRHTRLDMNYLCALAHDLAGNSEIKEKLRFFPNTSIYSTDNQLRYVEYSYSNSKRMHHLVSVDRSPYLERVIKAASKGVLLEDLRLLLHKSGIPEEEGNEFLNELLESQLLVSELEPALSGPEFLEQILLVLKRINNDQAIFSILKNVHKMIKNIDQNGIGQNVSVYKNVTKKLKQVNTSIDKKFLFQVDMKKPAHTCNISVGIVSDTLKGIEVLKKLSSSSGISRLKEFRRKFFERYEEREIPLLEALDTDLGPGYGLNPGEGGVNPLLDDLVFSGNKTSTNISWDGIQSFYLKKYQQALIDGSYEVVVKENELKNFQCSWDDFPDTFATLIRVIKNKDTYDIILDKVGGSGAANLSGRFCYADDAVCELVKEISEKEKSYDPNVILAEIIHLPQARTANILQRPIMREYELPFLGKASVAESRQIKPDDLVVSVRDNRFLLRSKRLNKIIIPRLSTAHNFSDNALAVYQFLCDLQLQGKVGSISFDWGVHSDEYGFLPRVKYKNIILSLASWNVSKHDIKDLLKITDDNGLLSKVDDWRRNNKIPQKVVLCDYDNELMIDFCSVLSIRMLFSLVKNRPVFQIKEFLFNDDNSIVLSEEGSFSSELILSFYRK